MASDHTRLLEHIVYQQFGSAVGEVASLLLNRGSLPFTHLLRLSALPPALIHQSLLVLSLHSLLWHSETETGGKLLELYEMNEARIEQRMRVGRFIEMAEEKEGGGIQGKAAGWALEGLWREGMRRGQDLVTEIGGKIWREEQQRRAKASNGAAKGKGIVRGGIGSIDEAEEIARVAVAKAFHDGFLSIITPGSQLSPDSLEIKWEEELKLSIKGIVGSKDIKEIKMSLERKWEEWKEEERERAKGQTPDASGNEPKRKKRKKTQRVFADEDEDDESAPVLTIPEDAFFRINAERFHIRWRSELMRKFAEDLYNVQVAAVFGVILDLAENDVQTMEDSDSRSVSLNEIVAHLRTIPSVPDLSECFPPPPPGATWSIPNEPGALVFEICSVLSDSGEGLRQMKETRRGHTRAFLKAEGVGSPAGARWRVDYEELGARMKRRLVEAMIEDRLGEDAVRCWRVLDARGKLDEKHLARLAFLSVKDAREVIARLSDASLIAPQEVPRSADRAPSRTFFLWYVDYDKVVSALLDHQYKAMANLQAQKGHQLKLAKVLVEKRDRSDVRAEPDKLLSKKDKENIAELDKILEALTVAEMRIDQDVFVLREMDPNA